LLEAVDQASAQIGFRRAVESHARRYRILPHFGDKIEDLGAAADDNSLFSRGFGSICLERVRFT
jgi:hypothetical protein